MWFAHTTEQRDAFLYGAGDEKIGSIIGKGAKAGKKLKEQFLNSLPALKRLREQVQHVAKTRGWLKGLDGRKIPVRSQHAALNTLLQSAGAIVMKQALVHLYDELVARGQKWGTDFAFVANIHDEFQASVQEPISTAFGKLAVESIAKAGATFGFRCPLTGEYRIGKNWKETH